MTASETTEVIMPLMGEGITEATLVRWLKKPGEAVRKEEPLLEVSTDKVDTEIPAPTSGVLVATFVKDGETVPINMVIAQIGGVAPTSERPAPAAAAPSTPTHDATRQGARSEGTPKVTPTVSSGTPLPSVSNKLQRSSPLVRKIARAEGVDLDAVAGTGLHGRITKRDMETYLSNKGQEPSRPETVKPSMPLAVKRDGARETLDGVPVRREKMSRMRSLIAEHMVRSVRTSPHVTTVFEIDMHLVAQTREKFMASFFDREGFKLTYTPFIAWAAVQAIKQHPIVNVSVDGDDILWKETINLGVAVALPTGLIVPVVKDAGTLNVLGLARRLNDLATRARTKRLTPEDVQGGTFSVTNPGMFGSIVSTPIINQPQVAILSVGAIVKRPVVIDDLIGIRPLCQIGLTFDHRVVDGADGAAYLGTLKTVLEGFSEAVL